MEKEIRIVVSYRMGSAQFPLDEELDRRIREAMGTMGAVSYGSGSGCGGRDLVFKLGNRQSVEASSPREV